MRRKLPFGIAQVRKSFRNEITPGNFVFRTLEFEQMEIEYFVEPGTDEQWFERWVDERERWYVQLGDSTATTCGASSIRETSCRTTQSGRSISSIASPSAKAGASSKASPTAAKGLTTVAGTCGSTSRRAASDLTLFDEDKKAHVRPGVVEPAAGLTRAALTFLIDAYDEKRPSTLPRTTCARCCICTRRWRRTSCACCRCTARSRWSQAARKVHEDLRRRWMITYDSGSNIGKLYRRQDEIGTPYCVTIDFQTLDDHAVTIRDRDSMQQERVAIADLRGWFEDKVRLLTLRST